MKSIQKLAEERRAKDRETIEGTYGEIGKLNADGSYTVFVPGVTNEVFVRINGDPNKTVAAINQKVTPKARLPVRMRLNGSKRWEILDTEPLRNTEFMGEAAGTANLPALVGDALNLVLDSYQFRPGIIEPLNSSDLQVKMSPLPYHDTLLGDVTMDLATAVGTIGSGLKALIVISCDPSDNTLNATKGTDVGLAMTLTRAMAMEVAIPAGDIILKAYVIADGDTVLPTTRMASDPDFEYDLRSWITLPGGSGSALAVTDGTTTVDPNTTLNLDPSFFDVSDPGGGQADVTLINVAPDDATYITQTPSSGLANEQAMSALTTGLVKNTTATGVQSIATAGTDYTTPTGAENLTNKTIDSSPIGTTARALGYFSALREYIGGFAAIFTHANTADRTYTYQDISFTVGRDTFVFAKNVTGSTITANKLVYFGGASTIQNATIAGLAIATSISTIAQGITTASIANNAFGVVQIGGIQQGATSASGYGVHYLSDSSAGSFTNVAPTGTSFVQVVLINSNSVAGNNEFLLLFEAPHPNNLNGAVITAGTVPAARLGTMTGATFAGGGASGAVPTPAAADNTKLLSGGGAYVRGNLTLFSQGADVTLASPSTAETTLIGTGLGSATIPADYLNEIGRTFAIYAVGYATRAAGNTTIRVKVGGTTIFTLGASALTWGTNNRFELYCVFTTKSTGSTGTIKGQGYFDNSGSTTTFIRNFLIQTGTTTLDLTGTLAVDFTWQWSSNAGQSVTCPTLIISQLAA